MVEELAKGLFQVTTDIGGRPLNCWLLEGDRNVVIDSGTPEAAANMLDVLSDRKISLSKTMFIITHADVDHFGGNNLVRSRSVDVTIACSETDRRMIEDLEVTMSDRYEQFRKDHGIGYSDETLQALRAMSGAGERVDIAFTGGERVGLSSGHYVRIFSTPGHTAGHISIWDPRSRTFIIADSVLRNGVESYSGDLIQPPTYLDRDWYLNTIQLVESLEPNLLLTGHFSPMSGPHVATFVKESRDWVFKFSAAVDEVLAKRKTFTLKDLIEPLDAKLGPYPLADDFVYALTAEMRVKERRREIERVSSESDYVSWKVL